MFLYYVQLLELMCLFFLEFMSSGCDVASVIVTKLSETFKLKTT